MNKARDWDPFSCGGRISAIRTVHAALDAGINYIATAPGYGDGNSEYIDVIQFHGGGYTEDQVNRILNRGPLEVFLELQEQGRVRFIGLTVEEPWRSGPPSNPL